VRVVQVASGAQAEGLGRWDAALEVLSDFFQCFIDCDFALFVPSMTVSNLQNGKHDAQFEDEEEQ
jgi:hypothetical protein